VVFVVYLMYPSLCREAFSLLACEKVDGVQYLNADLQERCWVGRHLVYFLCCTLPQVILHIIGIPLLGLHAARRGRTVRMKMKYSIALFRYGMLFSAYNDKRWYWGAIVAFQKAFIAFLSKYLTDPGLQVHWIVIFMAMSLLANTQGDPYNGVKTLKRSETRELYVFDYNAMFLLLLTAWSGTFFDHYLCGVHHGWCFVFMMVIVAANVAFFAYCIYSLRSYIRLTFGILFRKARGKKKKPAKMSVFELTEVAHVNPLYADDPEAPHSAPEVRKKCPSVRETLDSFRETAEEKAVRVSIARSTRSERDLLARRHSKMFIAAAIKDAKMRKDSDSLHAKFHWWK
jgi:hypothetical protein